MGIKQVKPNNGKFRQGYYKPEHPEKYIGNVGEIIFRSSWERKFMIYCDRNPDILNWSSETLYINYINPLNNKENKYYPDFLVKMKTNEEVKMILIEIKPSKQVQRPILRSNKSKHIQEYNSMMANYVINISKWKAAKDYSDKNDFVFLLITEKDQPLASKKLY